MPSFTLPTIAFAVLGFIFGIIFLMKILGTGLSGLVGSRIVELLKHGYEFEVSDIDITDRHRILERIDNSDASVVLHLAAKTDVDGCEKDKEEDQELLNRHSGNPSADGASRISNRSERFWTSQNDEEWNGKKTAWAVNVYGTQNIVDACQKSNKKLIYISTDFVFDGENPSVGGYAEEDAANPINWYGQTKYEGERIVQNISTPWVIARIAYPYRANFARSDFARAILKRLQDQKPVAAVIDHKFSPTLIDDVAFAIIKLIDKEREGIFHVVGSQSLTPYDATLLIAKIFNCSQSLISKTTRAEFFENRAPRPFRLVLKNDKIENLGIKMRGFEEGLEEIKKQMFTLSS